MKYHVVDDTDMQLIKTVIHKFYRVFLVMI